MARARRPLPVPVSPRIKTGGRRRVSECRRRSCSTCARTATSPALSPINSSSDAMVPAVYAASTTTGGSSPPASEDPNRQSQVVDFPNLPPLALLLPRRKAGSWAACSNLVAQAEPHLKRGLSADRCWIGRRRDDHEQHAGVPF